MKEKKEKKSVCIPRIVVYVAAFVMSVITCLIFGFAFGFDYALEFATNAICLTAVALVAYNICEKIDEQPWRLTPKYWGLVALILVTDFLFMFCAKSPNMQSGSLRSLIFLISAIVLGFYTYYVYAPSQRDLIAEVKKKVKEAVAGYITEHEGETSETIADGLVELVMAPKENVMTKEEVKGEEENA